MPAAHSYRIMLIASRLNLPGGAERAIVNLAHLLIKNGHAVTILILDSTIESFYPIDPGIELKQFPLYFGIGIPGNPFSRKLAMRRDIRELRKILTEDAPDFLIATEYHYAITACQAAGKLKTKVLAWEHHHFNWLEKSWFWRQLTKRYYPKLDAVVCLNSKEKEHYDEMGCNTVVIPNFIGPAAQQATCESKKLLTVGWLIPRKGIDFIMTMAATLLPANPGWTWTLVGGGEMEAELRQFIQEKKLENQLLTVPPAQNDLRSFYLEASIFVLASRFECFPMVLLEAMSMGLPCVSFDCPTGPADIIRHEADGLLVEPGNTDKLAGAIQQLMNNEIERKNLGRQAALHIRRFGPDEVAQIWHAIFEKLSLPPGR